MTTKEMIEVMQAYENGEEIESKGKFKDGNCWHSDHFPVWDWLLMDYRIKHKASTRLEVANKFFKDTFGIEKAFREDNCMASDCKFCPLNNELEAGCAGKDASEWWNETVE